MTNTSVLPPASERTGTRPGTLRVLVVDDDETIREALRQTLEALGHEVTAAAGAEHAAIAVARRRFHLALVDLRLGGDSGLDLLPKLLEADTRLAVVMLTAFGSIPSAVEAMRLGAFDYLPKPTSPDALEILTARVAERRRLDGTVRALAEDVKAARMPALLDTTSPVMSRAISTARQVAETDAIVVLTGESGTGKGVLARAIHGWSPRAEQPFSVVNCPALSAELLRSELFGHVKGSFTGATENKVGKVEYADGGTVLLDEIGELDQDIQPRLLRFLQDREYERVGDPTPRQADVRLIAATNRDLARAVSEGRFREDLFYRLNVIEIALQPLRERPDDIVPLAELFLGYYAARYGKRIEGFSEAAIRALANHDWPGNVRELQNVIERAVILERRSEVGAGTLPSTGDRSVLAAIGAGDPEDLPTLEGMEERYIRHVMEVTDSVERAAEVLGVAPSTLWRRRRKYGI